MGDAEIIYVRADDFAELTRLERIGFHKQHIVARLTAFREAKIPSDLQIRPASNNELLALMQLERQFEDHMMSPKINAQFDRETDDEMREGFLEQLANNDFINLVAELDSEIIGMAYACNTIYSGLHSGDRRPPNSATFAKCVVSSEHRRKGIGKALATVTIERLFELGFETIVSDWRILNTEANQTWSSIGFEPTWYRMVNE